MHRIRILFAVLGALAVLAFVAAEADAAPRMNSGSRGSRTHTAPPPTATSPNTAQPIQRTMTQPGAVARPATPATQPGGLFNRPGLMGGLAAGFLGAGLIGLMMGHGFAGGLAGLASIFGLILQVGLIVIVAALVWRWWQRRSQPATAPATAYASGPATRDMNAAPQQPTGFGFGGGAAAPVVGTPIEISPQDYEVFERTLKEVQTAYSNEDLGGLRMRVTPEMLSYYSEELAANASRGVINKLTDVKLVQGDLAEAWREGSEEYATVAMRYSQVDKIVDRNTGRVVEGSDTPDEGVEYWTFRRGPGGAWVVSAIQQTD